MSQELKIGEETEDNFDVHPKLSTEAHMRRKLFRKVSITYEMLKSSNQKLYETFIFPLTSTDFSTPSVFKQSNYYVYVKQEQTLSKYK